MSAIKMKLIALLILLQSVDYMFLKPTTKGGYIVQKDYQASKDSLSGTLKHLSAESAFSCKGKCSGYYDLCDSTALSIGQQLICFTSRIHCLKNCAQKRKERLERKKIEKIQKKKKKQKLNWTNFDFSNAVFSSLRIF